MYAQAVDTQREPGLTIRPPSAPFRDRRPPHAGFELEAVAARRASTDLPRPDDLALHFVNQPVAPAPAPTSPPAPAPKAPATCTPTDIQARISGQFFGGKTMDDYFPDLKGAGVYLHPDSAGPFDTGSSVGANAQIVGRVASTCQPADFTLGQTVTFTRARANGLKVDKEGTSEDDIAASTRDQSKAPFRQVWTAFGLTRISMADPPSVTYGPRRLPLAAPRPGEPPSEWEFDREFVTSLSGGGVTRSVTWKTSIRVVNGTVTSNTIS